MYLFNLLTSIAFKTPDKQWTDKNLSTKIFTKCKKKTIQKLQCLERSIQKAKDQHLTQKGEIKTKRLKTKKKCTII